MTLAGLGILLLLAPFKIILAFGNRGNCSFLSNHTFELVCHSTVPADLFNLYRDNRATENTPYSVWQSGDENGSIDQIILVSFHDNILHSFKTLQIENYATDDLYHSFLVTTSARTRRILFQPSILHCFRFSLRYPMELRSHCMGVGRSTEVAEKPALFYAMEDLNPSRKAAGDARTVMPFGALFLLVSLLLLVFS